MVTQMNRIINTTDGVTPSPIPVATVAAPTVPRATPAVLSHRPCDFQSHACAHQRLNCGQVNTVDHNGANLAIPCEALATQTGSDGYSGGSSSHRSPNEKADRLIL